MKKQYLSAIFFVFFCYYSFGQISFQKGYFIKNTGERVECFIKNLDWNNSPVDFKYKLSLDQENMLATIQNTSEFAIENQVKYIRAKVLIDRSGNQMSDFSNKRAPIFNEETLFLKVLVEGKATLYQYNDENLIRYFIKENDTLINQLIYKQYLVDNMVGVNNNFRQQILNAFQQFEIETKDVEKLDYDKSELEDFFVKINQKISPESFVAKEKIKRDVFNLSIRPGISFNELTITNEASPFRDVAFDPKASFRIGVELEFVFPFFNNKWCFITEPTYKTYNGVSNLGSVSQDFGYRSAEVKYNSFDIPIGVRHYFFLNNKSKVYINGSIVLTYPVNSYVEYRGNNGVFLNKIDLDPSPNFSMGLGYKYQNRYGIEILYYTNKQLINSLPSYNSDYKDFSLVLSYTLF